MDKKTKTRKKQKNKTARNYRSSSIYSSSSWDDCTDSDSSRDSDSSADFDSSTDYDSSNLQSAPLFSLLIMNVARRSDGKGSADRRKQTIRDIIEIEHPDLILFQEFGWKGVSGRTWSKFPIDDRYQLSGNTEASLLYDSNKFLIRELSAKTLQGVLDEMKRKDGEVPTDFTPLPRMCARIVKSRKKKVFLCVSWHGRYSKFIQEKKLSSKRIKKRLEEFKNTMKFFNSLLSKIRKKIDLKALPMIIGGDFNINIKKIKGCVNSPFQIYEYFPAKRRSGNIIDFYITTTNLSLTDVKVLDISKLSEAKDPLKVLDHDPVKAYIRFF